MTTAHPTLVARLQELRQEAAALLGDIDTRVRPKPTRIEPYDDRMMPGPIWEPAEKWKLQVVDPDETPASVFVDHPHLWDGDILPLDPIVARQIGMAFLAAADWADRVRTRDMPDPAPQDHEENAR